MCFDVAVSSVAIRPSVLVVVWPELCSSGARRLLDGVKSWCQNTDLQEISLILILSLRLLLPVFFPSQWWLTFTYPGISLRLIGGFNPGFHRAVTVLGASMHETCVHPQDVSPAQWSSCTQALPWVFFCPTPYPQIVLEGCFAW